MTASLSRISRHAWMAVPLLLANCTTIPELGALTDSRETRNRRIVIDLGEQKAYLYHHRELVAVSPVSSGRTGKRTPTGRYRVTQKSSRHRSSLYGDYVRDGRIVKANVDIRDGGRPAGSRFVGTEMPYFLRFNGAIGMHAGKLPGYPASSGCVRLPKRQAKRFYNAVRVGTPVIVEP